MVFSSSNQRLELIPKRVERMSRSQDAIDARVAQLQLAINDREVGDEFELKELFDAEDWLDATDNLRLALSITVCFKKRITGWPEAIEPSIINVQIVGIRNSGRERMFRKINGQHEE